MEGQVEGLGSVKEISEVAKQHGVLFHTDAVQGLGKIPVDVEEIGADLASFATGLLTGRNSTGEKLDVPTEIANRFIPLVIQDMRDIYNEHGPEALPFATPSIFGLGSQTYGGVANWHLKGKDYPELNAELSRLKTSMGFPSSTAFGQELTNKEYKQLRKATGKAIATNLLKIMKSQRYAQMPDEVKVNAIERIVDATKSMMKTVTFPNKRRQNIRERAQEKARLISLLQEFRE